jgi:FtsP/CotA-like multicopper oxidase with cupredoxin domain
MTIILTISLAALFVTPAMVAADNDDKDEKDSKNSNGKTHLVEMKATNLPNGQLAYQMMSHIIDSKDVTEQRYGANPTPSIPGPIIIMDEGDKVELTLYNDLGEGCVSVHTHGVHYPIESDGTLAQINKVVDSSYC